MAKLMGIDCGTQSTKVIVYDSQSRQIIAEASAPHDIRSNNTGKREQLASWWIESLAKACKAIDQDAKTNIDAIGVSGQQHGFVPLDKDNNVIHPVKLWNDTTTHAECAEISRAYGGDEKLLDEVGNIMLPGYTAPKILFLKNHFPDVYAKLKTILLPHDYINYRLTNNLVMEAGDASGTGLFDIRKRTWHKKLIKTIDPDRDILSMLPGIIGPHQPAGVLTNEAASILGLEPGILVSPGGGDNMMGAIGTGTVEDGQLTISLGTSGTMYGYSAKPVIDPRGHLAAFCASTGGWLPLLCTMNCTVATELIRELLDTNLSELTECAGKVPAGSNGIRLLPYFNGERVPNFPKGTASVLGLTATNTTPANLLRASMESAILGLASGLESFSDQGFSPKQVNLIGGGGKNPLWRQMTADILSVPVRIPSTSEAAAFGAALQALWVYKLNQGNKISISSITKEHCRTTGEDIQPDKKASSIYKKVYKDFMSWQKLLAPRFR